MHVGRYPTMHSAFDNELVLNYVNATTTLPLNMAHVLPDGGLLWNGPADVIRASNGLPGAFSSVPHAAPQYGITMNVSPVTGGGGACS
jgi:hypothetical protein